MRVCSDCGREFEPSSRHLRCPACRSRDRCRCGQEKQAKSATCLACRESAGAANGNWRGGRTKHKAGYVMLKTQGHPRGGEQGYVFEHILVMEQALGRHLLPDETVHHLNGVKDDNRPENLELWVRPQPAGIRAIDALRWARMIVDRYDGTLPPPTTLRAKH
jgi:HNH endonuclease